VRSVLEQFLQTGRGEHFEVLLYCFMPDHLHLLVMGAEPSACSAVYSRQEILKFLDV
jgi:REP element-mobilizing transposase RayT